MNNETKNNCLHPHVNIILNTQERMFGPGNYRLLKYIEETGSLQQACLKMNLSYSKGSKMLKNVEKQLGYALVERWSGGNKGGGSRLSEKGYLFVEQYEKLVETVEKYTLEKFEEIFNNDES